MSADAALLALASELEAAARPFLAYDRDATVTSADPDYDEAIETGLGLYVTVKAVADRIFTHQPESLAGLLVQAHAATLVAEHSWDDTSEQVGQDGTLLRLLANGLFRLAGVDWRGRSLPDRPVSSARSASSSLDATLIPLAEAAIAEERAANAVSEAADHDLPPGTFARSMQLLELVTSTDARTPAGVAAKARVFLAHAAETDDLDGDWRCQALALSLARDATHLGAAG
ncbi:hypothetical protein MMR14E_13175 [Methylobacterium mesophilicum]